MRSSLLPLLLVLTGPLASSQAQRPPDHLSIIRTPGGWGSGRGDSLSLASSGAGKYRRYHPASLTMTRHGQLDSAAAAGFGEWLWPLLPPTPSPPPQESRPVGAREVELEVSSTPACSDAPEVAIAVTRQGQTRAAVYTCSRPTWFGELEARVADILANDRWLPGRDPALPPN